MKHEEAFAEIYKVITEYGNKQITNVEALDRIAEISTKAQTQETAFARFWRHHGTDMPTLERLALLQTLTNTGGSTSKAAKQLGVSVRKIQYRLKDWGLRAGDVLQRAVGA